MSNETSHPGHVAYVLEWLAANRERIAKTSQPPGDQSCSFSGSDFVGWLEVLVKKYERICRQEHARRPPFTQYTGD